MLKKHQANKLIVEIPFKNVLKCNYGDCGSDAYVFCGRTRGWKYTYLCKDHFGQVVMRFPCFLHIDLREQEVSEDKLVKIDSAEKLERALNIAKMVNEV